MKCLKEMFGRLERWWNTDAVNLAAEIFPVVQKAVYQTEQEMVIQRVGDSVSVVMGPGHYIRIQRGPAKVGYELKADNGMERTLLHMLAPNKPRIKEWLPWKNAEGCFTDRLKVSQNSKIFTALVQAWEAGKESIAHSENQRHQLQAAREVAQL